MFNKHVGVMIRRPQIFGNGVLVGVMEDKGIVDVTRMKRIEDSMVSHYC